MTRPACLARTRLRPIEGSPGRTRERIRADAFVRNDRHGGSFTAFFGFPRVYTRLDFSKESDQGDRGPVDSKEKLTRRRAVLIAGIGLTAAGSLPAQENPAALRPQEGDFLIQEGDPKAAPLTPGDIRLGARQTTAWAVDPARNVVRNGSRLNRILLLRLEPASFSPETRARAADGVVAYSAICTHAGCDVSEWIAEEQALFCSCHDSKFQPADQAKVVDGPAPRMLPALPLKIVEGRLVVAGPFTSRIAFEQG